jgi:hypothetical protein
MTIPFLSLANLTAHCYYAQKGLLNVQIQWLLVAVTLIPSSDRIFFDYKFFVLRIVTIVSKKFLSLYGAGYGTISINFSMS